MSDPQTEQPTDEDRTVHEWRLEQFLGLGFDLEHAEWLALNPEVETEFVRHLISLGCSVTDAWRIAA